MTACASVRPQHVPVLSCAEPDLYIEEPGLRDLIEALNDTYLAWEDCHATVERLKLSRVP